jgi:sialate O-acetylesterase
MTENLSMRQVVRASCIMGWIVATACAVAHATEPLQLGGMFTSHAVLQRDAPIPLWGSGRPGEAVTVTFADTSVTTTTGRDGRWITTLPPLPAASTPRSLSIKGEGIDRTLAIDDLLIGDVWLCCGQSNMGIHMAHSAKFVPETRQKLTAAGNPLLRLYKVPNRWQREPAKDVSGRWETASPQSAGPFSTIGYLLGEQIQREIGVPVGVIMAACGGTYIENWLPTELVESNPVNADFLKRWRAKGDPEAYDGPGYLFNGSIHPLIPYSLKGFLWYQGEANVGRYADYGVLLEELVTSWRSRWKLPDARFLAVEIAPYAHDGKVAKTPADSSGARLREVMAMAARRVPHLHVASIIDAGMVANIHPPDKRIPAERFTAIALREAYGQADRVCDGPRLESWHVDGGKAVVRFRNTGRGLEARRLILDGIDVPGSQLAGFAIAGEDKTFHFAEATITATDTVTLSSPRVPKPVAVRYAWADFPIANLFSRDGLPVTSFRTDDWPWQSSRNQ